MSGFLSTMLSGGTCTSDSCAGALCIPGFGLAMLKGAFGGGGAAFAALGSGGGSRANALVSGGTTGDAFLQVGDVAAVCFVSGPAFAVASMTAGGTEGLVTHALLVGRM